MTVINRDKDILRDVTKFPRLGDIGGGVLRVKFEGSIWNFDDGSSEEYFTRP